MTTDPEGSGELSVPSITIDTPSDESDFEFENGHRCRVEKVYMAPAKECEGSMFSLRLSKGPGKNTQSNMHMDEVATIERILMESSRALSNANTRSIEEDRVWLMDTLSKMGSDHTKSRL